MQIIIWSLTKLCAKYNNLRSQYHNNFMTISCYILLSYQENLLRHLSYLFLEFISYFVDTISATYIISWHIITESSAICFTCLLFFFDTYNHFETCIDIVLHYDYSIFDLNQKFYYWIFICNHMNYILLFFSFIFI